MSSCANSNIEWRITTNGEKFRVQSRNCRCESWADETEYGSRISKEKSLFFYIERESAVEFKTYALAEKHIKKKYGEQAKIVAREWRPA